MRSLLRVLAIATVALPSTACFSSQTLIKLRADGSGTVEQTNLVNTSMLGMAAGMAKSMAGDKTQGADLELKPDDMFGEEQLKKQAERMGTGVRFVSSERLTQGAMQGAKAIYAFDRVETLTVGTSQHLSGREHEASEAPRPQVLFSLAPQGSQSRLTVTFPEPKATGAAPSTPDNPVSQTPQIPPEAFAMVKSMFEGARMGIDVEVDGRIISTNAPASAGSRVTLVEVDFGELLSDPSKLQALQALKPGVDFATVRKTLDGVKGVKMPSQPTVTVDFSK